MIVSLSQSTLPVSLHVFLPISADRIKTLTLAICWLGLFFFFLFTSTWCYYHPVGKESAPAKTRETAKRAPFWVYALPMAAVWGVFLLVFFPGILSPDSIDQWTQASGLKEFTDWHPVIHTLLLWLTKQVWDTTAGMAILQILALSLTVAWGIDELVEMGLPRWGAWLMSALFAVSPANGTMSITMWKDVIYGISLFGLFLIGVKMAVSRGEWLQKRGRWVGLGLTAGVSSVFRHNGLVVVIGILLILWLVYRGSRRQVTISATLALAVWFLVSYPLYNLVGVVRVSGTLRDTIFLHHISAHVGEGTPLTDVERDYLNALKPLEEWQYDCCDVGSVYYRDYFNNPLFAENTGKHLGLAIYLAIRDPMVDIRHMFCSSSVVWRICNDQCAFMYHYISNWEGHYDWV